METSKWSGKLLWSGFNFMKNGKIKCLRCGRFVNYETLTNHYINCPYYQKQIKDTDCLLKLK
jgi:hypothetical protein